MNPCSHSAWIHRGDGAVCYWCSKSLVIEPLPTPRDVVDAFLDSLDWGKP